jgi:AraC family ethanolamine operon transcriptional activator
MAIYLNRRFNNFEDMASAFSIWNAEIRQLQRGKSTNHLIEFSTKDLSITNGIFNVHTQQKGLSPTLGATVAILSDKISNLNWRKKEVGSNCLMVMPPGCELDVVTKAHAGVYTITLSGKTLEKMIRVNSEIEKILTQNQLLTAPVKMVGALRSVLLRYQLLLDQTPTLISQTSFVDELNWEISEKIVTCLTHSCCVSEPSKLINKKKVWNRIEYVFEKTSAIDLRVSELCRMTKVSESTLLRLFKERFDLPPKTYINMVRLNGLHKELINGVTSNLNISDCANDWGFWHMGQLAKDYKRMFGELPSETLRTVIASDKLAGVDLLY